jgi:pyrroloquinoline quinone (PQQ) biosynthesis protein C
MTVVTTRAGTLPVDEFVEDLVSTMRSLKRPKPSRLMVGIFTGKAPVEAVARYTLEQYAYSRFAVNCIAAAIARMLERDNFLMLSENFSREAGFYQTGNHVEILVNFGEALGLTREQIESHTPLPETLGAMYTLAYFCNRSAAEAVASFSIATEARGEILSENKDGTVTIPPFSEVFKRNYGLSDDAVAFWKLHEEIEGDDAEQGFKMIRAYADSAYNQHLIRQAVVHTSLTFDAMWYSWDRFLDE